MLHPRFIAIMSRWYSVSATSEQSYRRVIQICHSLTQCTCVGFRTATREVCPQRLVVWKSAERLHLVVKHRIALWSAYSKPISLKKKEGRKEMFYLTRTQHISFTVIWRQSLKKKNYIPLLGQKIYIVVLWSDQSSRIEAVMRLGGFWGFF